MPARKPRSAGSRAAKSGAPTNAGHGPADGHKATRAFWSGTITFGLVSIPVDFFAAVGARETAMKMVDAEGSPLGREYYSDKTNKALGPDDLVRGYETDEGRMITVTDEELESVAPELTRDIELRVFVRKEEIHPAYFQHPYFLAPSGRSARAYHLLARVMEETGRVGVGTFVMHGHQYLVAIRSRGRILHAETLHFAGEVRAPQEVGLPKIAKPSAAEVNGFAKAIQALTRDRLDVDELSDRYAEKIRERVEQKVKKHQDVVDMTAAAGDEEDEGGNVIDLMALLRQRLGVKAKPAGGAVQRGSQRSQRSQGSRRKSAA